ncbi:TRAP transporter small permease [Pelagibaca abyssi]|nr:TRAP transporter small permease [Salipiger abyssi]
MDETGQEAARRRLPPARVLGRAGTALAVAGGLMLTIMMGLTVCDVIGRYVFSAPVKGAAELTEILLAAVIFLGLGAVSLSENHVTVDLLTEKLPSAVEPLRLALTGLFSAAVLGVVSWRLWIYAAQIGGYGGSTSTLAIPVAPLGYFCAICAAIGAVITAILPVRRLALRLLA